jgi:ferredoxin
MKAPVGKEAQQAIQESIEKCPSKAIVLNMGDKVS